MPDLPTAKLAQLVEHLSRFQKAPDSERCSIFFISFGCTLASQCSICSHSHLLLQFIAPSSLLYTFRACAHKPCLMTETRTAMHSVYCDHTVQLHPALCNDIFVIIRETQGLPTSQNLGPEAKESRGVAAEVQEKYIELMCQFDPTAVHHFIRSFDGYRLEETLEVCINYCLQTSRLNVYTAVRCSQLALVIFHSLKEAKNWR